MKIGVIGGSGVYDLDGLTDVECVDVETPFGSTSDSFVHGFLDGHELFFLPRHGKGHTILPGEINHKANIMAFKMLGAEIVISISAVGSLQEQYRPRDIVLPDQYYDRTKKGLEHTFFGNGLVGHVGFGDPVCESVRSVIHKAALKVVSETDGSDVRITNGGTYVNMEGPAFSSKAESNIYRQLGCDIIGMTSLPEAKLCREAEMCYQSIAMVTDYDCWRENEENVTVEMIIGHLTANAALAQRILKEALTSLSDRESCSCNTALQCAIVTQKGDVPPKTLSDLKPIVGKYFDLD